MQFESWLLFSSIAFIATASPGPAVLLVTTHSLQYGPFRTLMTIAGNVSGLLIMSACSVLGLNALILYSATAFTCIKLFGAAYLIYMGVKLWRSGILSPKTGATGVEKQSCVKLYVHGILVALTNPKAIVFTTALFPQFIVSSEPLLPQFSILVITFMSLSALCLLVYSVASSKAQKYSVNIFSGKRIGKIFGGAFIGAGALLATTVQN